MSKAEKIWLDANVLLRYLVDSEGDHLERATALLERGAKGEVTLCLSPMIMAECVWVLKSFYKVPQAQIAATLLRVIELPALNVEQHGELRLALQLMAEKNVNFTDAYLSAHCTTQGGQIATFDQDFKRLGVSLLAF